MGVVETGFVIAAAVALIASLVVMAMFASTATKFTGDMIEDSRKPIKPKSHVIEVTQNHLTSLGINDKYLATHEFTREDAQIMAMDIGQKLA